MFNNRMSSLSNLSTKHYDNSDPCLHFTEVGDPGAPPRFTCKIVDFNQLSANFNFIVCSVKG